MEEDICAALHQRTGDMAVLKSEEVATNPPDDAEGVKARFLSGVLVVPVAP